MEPLPTWTRRSAAAYSLVAFGIGDPVDVFVAADDRPLSLEEAGELALRLVPDGGWGPGMHVLDAAGNEIGRIRTEGIPGFRYVMRRSGEVVWTLSVRSLVRTRHRLELAQGDTWTFETPLFTWMNVRGTTAGGPKLLGYYRSSKRLWLLWLEPGRATPDLLAAVAFMHRQWARW